MMWIPETSRRLKNSNLEVVPPRQSANLEVAVS